MVHLVADTVVMEYSHTIGSTRAESAFLWHGTRVYQGPMEIDEEIRDYRGGCYRLRLKSI